MELRPTGLPRIISVISLMVGFASALVGLVSGFDYATIGIALNGLLGFGLLWSLSDAVDHLAKGNQYLSAMFNRQLKN